MDEIESYLNLNVTYLDYYLEHNEELSQETYSAEKLYMNVSGDVDIVFGNLNILPNKCGYLFWKDAVFLYLYFNKSKTSFSKDIYPLIAQKHETSVNCVDRAMRRCFENVLYYASKNEHNYVYSYLKKNLLWKRVIFGHVTTL